ncbi:MAG: nucleotidyltransferase domain-containing protein [Cellulosilyticaceae bacterium]
MAHTITCYQFSKQYSGIETCLNYIYYTQVDAVREIIHRAQSIPEIQYIILFGSSITLGCGQDSDIDLLVIADCYDEDFSIIKKLRQSIAKPMDILPETLSHFKSTIASGNTLYNEIKQKGLIIYERSS